MGRSWSRAPGTVGRHLVRALLAAGQDVLAGVRDPAGAELPAGAVPVRLDFTDAATATPALDAVSAVPAPATRDQQRPDGARPARHGRRWAAYLAQNLLTAFGEDIRQRSELRLAAHARCLSFVDARDVAAVPGHALTGPQALTLAEAAAR